MYVCFFKIFLTEINTAQSYKHKLKWLVWCYCISYRDEYTEALYLPPINDMTPMIFKFL